MKHTALITGASRGIGAALACRFAAEGYHLALCCHNSYETLQALATKLETTYSIQVLCFRGDVGDYTFICDMVQKTLDTFGQIDVLINNAGISYIGLLTDMDITDWNRIVATNLTSVFSTCRQVIPSMVHAKSGLPPDRTMLHPRNQNHAGFPPLYIPVLWLWRNGRSIHIPLPLLFHIRFHHNSAPSGMPYAPSEMRTVRWVLPLSLAHKSFRKEVPAEFP